MSTTVKMKTLSPEEQQRRKKIRTIKRNIRMAIFFILICTIAVMSIVYAKNVRALNKQILELNNQVLGLTSQVQQLTETNTDLAATIKDNERTLEMFIDPNELVATQPTTYDIPLDAALQEHIYNLCVDYCIPEHYELVLALIWQESNFDASVVSSTGDYGLMQINTINHDWLSEELGVDDFLNPEQNVHAGVYVLAKLIHKHGDVGKALMSYNMGERGAASYWSAGIYTSTYSDSVIAKLAAIKMNNYGSK